MQLKMLCFESQGIGFAIDLEELAAAAGSCPFVAYPGLPKNVTGIVQWGGKIFPVVDLWSILNRTFKVEPPAGLIEDRMFVFSQSQAKGKFKEFAVPIPADVRMIAPAEVKKPGKDSPFFVKSIVRDTEGNEAHVISLSSLALAV